jgi:hypothetical protein
LIAFQRQRGSIRGLRTQNTRIRSEKYDQDGESDAHMQNTEWRENQIGRKIFPFRCIKSASTTIDFRGPQGAISSLILRNKFFKLRR